MFHCFIKCIKQHRYIFLIILTLVYLGLITTSIALNFHNNGLKCKQQSFELLSETILGVLALVQLRLVYKKLIYDEYCSYWKLKRGAKKIAKEMDEYKPDLIIMTEHNSKKLFLEYIWPKLKNRPKVLYYNIIKKSHIALHVESSIMQYLDTPKFLLSYPKTNMNEFKEYTRILIFDDVSLTGSTLAAITDDLLDQQVNKKNIYRMAFVASKYCAIKNGLPGYNFIKADISDGYSFIWRD